MFAFITLVLHFTKFQIPGYKNSNRPPGAYSKRGLRVGDYAITYIYIYIYDDIYISQRLYKLNRKTNEIKTVKKL